MKIAVNTRVLLPTGMDGIGWFTYEVFKRLSQKFPEHEFHFLFDRQWDEQFLFAENVVPHNVFPQARHPILFYWWFEHSLPRALKKIQPDVFVSPDGFVPLKGNFKVLNVLHDINFHHNPDDFGFWVKHYYQYFVPKFAQRANRLATVSSFCRTDIAESYGLAKEKIDVVYNGVSKIYEPLSDEEKKKTRRQYAEGKPYFLFLGTIVPRKNLKNLLLAFDKFKSASRTEHKLLVVGSKKYWTSDLETVYGNMKFKEEVAFLGYQMPEAIRYIMGSAAALAFVSLFEGFGVPIVEAMKSGVPVITSNTTACNEVAQEAAYLVNPQRPEEIARAMKVLVDDETKRKALIEKGLKRAADFNWDRTAELVWASILKTVA